MKILLIFLLVFVGSALGQINYYKSWFDSLNLSSLSSKNSSKSSAPALQRKNLEVNNVPNLPKENRTKVAINSLNLSQNSDLNSSSILKAAIKQSSSPVKSFQSIFARFPSKEEIKQISEDGDVGAITKTLQVVSFDTQVPCNIKIPYLMDLLGTVKDNVKVKTAQSDYQSIIIDSAQSEIQRIQSQIDRKQKQKEDLNLKMLDAKVVDLSGRFYSFSNQITNLNNNIAPEQARIVGFENQLNIIENQSQYQRNYMSINKITLVDVENLIRDLKNKLEEAETSRGILQERINSSQNTLENNQIKKDKIRQSINETNKKIQTMRDQGDELKRQSYHLEVDLERARTNLSVQQVKEDKLNYQIEGLNNKKAKEQSKINQDNLQNMKNIIKNSKTIIPSISNELNRQYYYCYGDGKFSIQDIGSTRVYTINSDNFANYIQTAYGKKIDSQQLRTNDDIQLKIIDSDFQIPNFKFGSNVSLQNLYNTNQAFNCMSNETLTSDVGKILGIQASGLIVSGVDGRSIRLAIAGCTRIESTSRLLSIGQNIAWKGLITSVGKFNLSAATCWS